MAIPESQLETWCNQGAITTSSQAYASIKAAIDHVNSDVKNRNPEVYLQGSYGNSTNIYAESDVDVVVQLNSVWGRDLASLPASQQQAYAASVDNATYGAKQFRSDVLKSLQKYYGTQKVKTGPNAILVTTPNGRTVDVIAALEYRNYIYFYSSNSQLYVPGVKFENASGSTIINYPKHHIQNGEDKNSPARTNWRYKQTVRMFKNARSHLINNHKLAADVAPSYFVECLLYNVPDNLFTGDRQQTFSNVWNFLWSKIDTTTAKCQNEQGLLFGDSPQQWTLNKAFVFLNELKDLWNNWS